ncbi:MAG: hypothetical protein WC412_02140 [Candidatus Omnitrophota bacterium]|jgi:hypothetical protein
MDYSSITNHKNKAGVEALINPKSSTGLVKLYIYIGGTFILFAFISLLRVNFKYMFVFAGLGVLSNYIGYRLQIRKSAKIILHDDVKDYLEAVNKIAKTIVSKSEDCAETLAQKLSSSKACHPTKKDTYHCFIELTIFMVYLLESNLSEFGKTNNNVRKYIDVIVRDILHSVQQNISGRDDTKQFYSSLSDVFIPTYYKDRDKAMSFTPEKLMKLYTAKILMLAKVIDNHKDAEVMYTATLFVTKVMESCVKATDELLNILKKVFVK